MGIAVLTIAAGVLVISAAYAAGRAGSASSPWVAAYWLGEGTVFAPLVWRLISRPALGRAEAATLVLATATATYLVKVCYSPAAFGFPDELEHWRTTATLLSTHHLFGVNYLLPVSAVYPGIEEVTGAVAAITGLPVFVAGLIVAGLAHLLFTAALFVMFGLVGGSPRVAATACAIYAANPHYQVFDAIYGYQTLALAFFALTLLAARAATSRDEGFRPDSTSPIAQTTRWQGVAPGRIAWWALALALSAATVVTHHITSYALAASLLLVAVTSWGVKPTPPRPVASRRHARAVSSRGLGPPARKASRRYGLTASSRGLGPPDPPTRDTSGRYEFARPGGTSGPSTAGRREARFAWCGGPLWSVAGVVVRAVAAVRYARLAVFYRGLRPAGPPRATRLAIMGSPGREGSPASPQPGDATLAAGGTGVRWWWPGYAAMFAGGLAVGCAGLVAIWVGFVATGTGGYLAAPLHSFADGLSGIFTAHSSGSGSATPSGPLADRLAGYAATGLIMAALPFGWWRIWRTQRHRTWAVALGVGSAAYYVLAVLRITTPDGAEIAGRGMTFVFIPVAYTLAIALARISNPVIVTTTASGRHGCDSHGVGARGVGARGVGARGVGVRRVRVRGVGARGVGVRRVRVRRVGVLAAGGVAGILLGGGIASGWPPYWERLPGQYVVDGFESGITPEGIAAANWARVNLGPGNRIAADFTDDLLLGSYGDQDPVGNLDALYCDPVWTEADALLARQQNIGYLLVDLRMSEHQSVTGGYFTDASPACPSPIPRQDLTKFDTTPGFDRIYDSGNIAIYKLSGAQYAP